MKYILFSLCAKILTVLIYSFSGRIASGNREKKRFFIKMIFTDTHFHLCEDIPLPDYIKEAQKENVQKFLLNTGSLKETQEASFLAKSFSGLLKYTAGIHPGSVADLPPEEKENTASIIPSFREFASDPSLGAIGEIGLDFYYDCGPEEHQIQVFNAFLELALETGKSAVIHCRDKEDSFRAYEITYSLLKDFAEKGGSFDLHCYAGTVQWAEKFLDLGGFFGVGGMVTFKKAENIREIVRYLPLERILLETDAPYLAPVPYRGKPNRSKYIPIIGETVSVLKNIPLQDLAAITTENAEKLFDL